MEELLKAHLKLKRKNDPVIEEDDKSQGVKLIFNPRRRRREERLSKIKSHLEENSQFRERKQQNTVLFLLSLTFTFASSCLVAYIFIDFDSIPEQKAIFILITVSLGLILSMINSLLIAPSWKEVLKQYLMIDSCVPVMIASIIGFNAMENFVNTGNWYLKIYYVAFPAWVVYFGGSLRVMVAFGKCRRWEIITYKIVVLLCALVFFYIGFTFMNGGYKITKGYLTSVQSRFKDMVYLYVFGVVEITFQFLKRLCYFDQTDDLKFQYQFKDMTEEENRRIASQQYRKWEVEALREEINDILTFGFRRSSESSEDPNEHLAS